MVYPLDAILTLAVAALLEVAAGQPAELVHVEQEQPRLLVDPELGRRFVAVVAGSGEAGHSGDGGPATKATLNQPYEVRFDRGGNVVWVERLSAVNPDSGVLILAQNRAPTGTLVEVVDQVHLGGIYNITFSTTQ